MAPCLCPAATSAAHPFPALSKPGGWRTPISWGVASRIRTLPGCQGHGTTPGLAQAEPQACGSPMGAALEGLLPWAGQWPHPTHPPIPLIQPHPGVRVLQTTPWLDQQGPRKAEKEEEECGGLRRGCCVFPG